MAASVVRPSLRRCRATTVARSGTGRMVNPFYDDRYDTHPAATSDSSDASHRMKQTVCEHGEHLVPASSLF